MDCDYMSACIDEIALEGLDGITISGLWLRLEARPKFTFQLTHGTRQFLWKQMALRVEIEFFELQEEREPLIAFDRYESVDLEFGIVTEPVNLIDDVYPIAPINESGIRGSCGTFHTRKNVTQEIRDEFRSLKLNLQQVTDKWAEKLVLVANQNTRTVALLGPNSDPTIELSDLQYLILERIGRARYHGEVTQGKASLSAFKESPKSLHYQRKLLLAEKLVTKQIHYQRSATGVMTCGSLLHLTRFYIERKSKFLIILQLICNMLNEKPDKIIPIESLREKLGLKDSSWKKIFNKHLYQLTRVIQIPLQDARPNLPPGKYTNANGTPKTVRALQLLDTIDITKIGKEEYEEDEEEEEKPEIKTLEIKKWIPFMNRPFLDQTLEFLDQIGSEGITVRELSRAMGVPYLDARSLLKNLTKLKAATPIYKDVGKQRCTKYVSKKHLMNSSLRQQICEEGLKMLQFSKSEENCDKSSGSTTDLDAKEGTSSCLKTETLIDVVKKMEMPEFDFENSDLTYRKLKRVNIILKLVRDEKLIDNITAFRKAILNEESKEGIGAIVDPNTVRRLLRILYAENQINIINTNLTLGEKIVKMQFICDKDVTVQSSIFKSAIEQAKVKKFYVPNKSKKFAQKLEKDKEIEEQKIYELLPPGRSKTEVKFVRLKLLHQFLFYLIYGYDGLEFDDPTLVWEPNEDGSASSVPRVYKDDDSFKRFLPPLPTHSDWSSGWFLMSDVILRLPLNLFMKIINCPYLITELEPYLHDPIKKNCLISQLNPQIRRILFSGRRYIFSFTQNLELLARVGLLSFGPQQYKEKEQRFMYLHRTAAVLDTRTSNPSYCQTSVDATFKKEVFHLNSLADVEKFWILAQEICLQTPLGCRSSNVTVPVERVDTKTLMLAACAPKSVDEVVDDGIIPGDGRGAGGFDSVLYAHLQRNWCNLNRVKKSKSSKDEFPPDESDETLHAAYFYKNYLKQTNDNISNAKRLGRLQNRNLSLKSKDVIKITVKNVQPKSERMKNLKRKRTTGDCDPKKAKKMRSSPQKKTRVIGERAKTSTRRPYYDEIDKEALKRLPKKRVDWNSNEDSFLLLCKVASVLVAPNHHTQLIVASPLIRDLMRQHIPSCDDKTSRACQRRVMYMMRNPRTKYNVAVYVGEARQDEDLMTHVVNPNVPKTDEVAWETAFKNALKVVVEKFTSTKKTYSTLQLPDTIDQFYEKYATTSTDSLLSKKSYELELNNVVSLRFATVYTLIMSAICSAAHKDKWSVHLYRLYNDYPDTLLRSVITRLRTDQVIASKKSNSRKNRLQLTSIPYQVHIAFENKLRTKYKTLVFEEAREFYCDLQARKRTSEPFLIPPPTGGIAATVLTLLAINGVDLTLQNFDQLIQFESDTFCEQPKKRAKFNSDELISRKVSRVHLYMKRQQIYDNPADLVQHSQDYIVVIPCRVEINLKNKINDFDHDYLTDSEENDDEMCNVSRQLTDEIVKKQLNVVKSADKFDDVWKRCFAYEQTGYFEFNNIYQCISAAKELGVTLENVLEKFPNCDESKLKSYLHLMLTNGLIQRCGVNVAKYVSMDYIDAWLLRKFNKSSENVTDDFANNFLPRPWKMPDGTVNESMFATMLRSVLGCVMVKPGVEFTHLVDQLLPTLQAVYALELIEILHQINCISMTYMKKQRLTIFSAPNYVIIDAKVGDAFRDKLFLTPNVQCVLILQNFIANFKSD